MTHTDLIGPPGPPGRQSLAWRRNDRWSDPRASPVADQDEGQGPGRHFIFVKRIVFSLFCSSFVLRSLLRDAWAASRNQRCLDTFFSCGSRARRCARRSDGAATGWTADRTLLPTPGRPTRTVWASGPRCANKNNAIKRGGCSSPSPLAARHREDGRCRVGRGAVLVRPSQSRAHLSECPDKPHAISSCRCRTH